MTSGQSVPVNLLYAAPKSKDKKIIDARAELVRIPDALADRGAQELLQAFTQIERWTDKFSTAIGYSMIDIDNADASAPDQFKRGQYALGNLLYSPVPGVTTGVELQWGNRENNSNDFKADIFKVQFSFKYAFSKTY